MSRGSQRIIFSLFAALVFSIPALPVHAAMFSSYMGLGSAGQQVTNLQTILIDEGYLHATATGYFGSQTQKALGAFQAANGLSATGYVGPQTLSLLNQKSLVIFPAGSSATRPPAASAPSSSNTTGNATLIATLKAELALLESELALLLKGSASGVVSTGSSGGGGGSVSTTIAPVVSNGGGGGGSSSGSSSAPVTPAPTLTISLNPATVSSGGSSTLTWSTTNASACTGVSGLTGSQQTSGSQTLSNLTQGGTYTLTCTGDGGSVTQSATLTVTAPPAPPSPPSTFRTFSVYSGCAVPSTSAGTAFYVDAVNGNDSTGDGSQAHPWKTLQTVINTKVATNQYRNGTVSAVHTSGPIHPGDTIYLENGNYGDLSIQGLENSDFITIASAPGTSPVLTYLGVTGAKWIFENLTIENTKTSAYNTLVLLQDNATFGGNNNIIFDRDTVTSDPTALTTWSLSDWQTKASYRGILLDKGDPSSTSNCIAVTNSVVSMVANAVNIGIDKTLFDHNTIDGFGDDGLDYDSNNVTITHNLVTDSEDLGDGNHNDGMQGQVGRISGTSTTYSNIIIDNNFVARQTNPNLPALGGYESSFQGIDAFDEDWNNLEVENNVVLTNLWNGLAFSSVHGGTFAHNTVLNDGTIGGNDAVGGNPDNYQTRLVIGATTHQGATTTNVTVQDNIADQMIVNTTGITLQNNLILNYLDYISTSGVEAVVNNKNGSYGTNNVMDSAMHTYLTGFAPLSASYTVLPRSGTPAAGLGASLSLSDVGGTGANSANAYAFARPGTASTKVGTGLLSQLASAAGSGVSVGFINFFSHLWVAILTFFASLFSWVRL